MRSCHRSSVIAVLYAIGDRERQYNNKHHPGNYGNPRMAPQAFRVHIRFSSEDPFPGDVGPRYKHYKDELKYWLWSSAVVLHRGGAADALAEREAARVSQWRALDEHYAVGEFSLQLLGWDRAPLRGDPRATRAERPSLGRKLLEVPGYTFRVFVTNRALPPEEIWRDYNRRADMENRIAELKHDLAADDFCLHEFFATEAAFRSILLLFNLLGEFQRASGFSTYRQPATLRAQVFLCGALLGRAGHRLVLHLSASWGGLQQRIPLLENVLAYGVPTSPKLKPEVAT